jgi:hypothetical protein
MQTIQKYALTLVLLCSSAGSDLYANHRQVVMAGQRVAADPSHNCECRAQGRAWRLGEEICLNGRRAICGMDQNVTSWRMTDRSCPLASLD